MAVFLSVSASVHSRTYGPTDGRTDTPSYRDAWTHLKMENNLLLRGLTIKKSWAPRKGNQRQGGREEIKDFSTIYAPESPF